MDDCWHTAGSDGNGTKPILTVASRNFAGAPRDLLAMTGGDFTRYGNYPLVFLNDYSVATLGKDEKSEAFLASMEIMIELGKAAKEQGYILAGGETAELRDCIKSENPEAFLKFTFSGTMIGLSHPDKEIDGSRMRAGNRIIALFDVVRSNGISALRRGLAKIFGPNWYDIPEAHQLILEASAASALYDAMLVEANGWTTPDRQPIVKANLIAHLSGGGIQSKFGDDQLFPRGLSATLSDLWEPPTVMKECAKVQGMPDHDCYETWGCGQGALVVVEEEDVEKFMDLCRKYGILAKDAGYIRNTAAGHQPGIDLVSGFSGDVITLNVK
jgi:phosphoribosylaminoimidazole (AIR) synthetase